MGTVHAWRDGAVLTLELSHPGRANALDLAMLGQLDAQLRVVEADAAVRVVVLRGTQGGTFSSGADVRQWGPMPPEVFGRDWIAHGNAIFDRLEQLRCPTVAAIEGLCFGGGLELALCADLRLASTAARFRFPEVGIGAIPGWKGGTRLARLAGRGRALEAVLTLRTLDAVAAERWGMVNAVFEPSDFERGLDEWVGGLARVSPAAAALAKAAILTDRDAGEFCAEAGQRVKASDDARIGLQAFLDKQPARF
jgi:enoyl-CoA hydratase/carnithine racemase